MLAVLQQCKPEDLACVTDVTTGRTSELADRRAIARELMLKVVMVQLQ